jgi:nucleoside-diphosphate-sugar epimerase
MPRVAALITRVGYIGSALLGRLLARGHRVFHLAAQPGDLT